jgi:surface protein
MFFGSIAFNQDISGWDVSSGKDFVSMEHSFGFQLKTMQYVCDLIGSSNE